MSYLEQEIQRLTSLKKKADVFRSLRDELEKKLEENQSLSEPEVEVFNELITYYSKRSSEIEGLPKEPEPEDKNKLKFSEKVPTSPNEGMIVPKEGSSPPPATDPLRFLMTWKHLDNKLVTFDTPNGSVKGRVKGLVVPNVLVETDTGYVVKVDPTKLTV